MWQHIEFIDGSNPYICKTEKEFERMKRMYVLENITDNLWKATDRIYYKVVGFTYKDKVEKQRQSNYKYISHNRYTVLCIDEIGYYRY